MKTIKFFAMAAIVCGAAMSMTSCSKEDNPADGGKKQVTISFEGAKLNAQGFWIGDETGTPFDNWGSTAYACSYKESGVTFPVNYTPAWSSWSGFAVSNRTETTYKTLTPDQYNNIAGKARSGKNFCIVQTYGESIEFEKPVTIKGFWSCLPLSCPLFSVPAVFSAYVKLLIGSILLSSIMPLSEQPVNKEDDKNKVNNVIDRLLIFIIFNSFHINKKINLLKILTN